MKTFPVWSLEPKWEVSRMIITVALPSCTWLTREVGRKGYVLLPVLRLSINPCVFLSHQQALAPWPVDPRIAPWEPLLTLEHWDLAMHYSYSSRALELEVSIPKELSNQHSNHSNVHERNCRKLLKSVYRKKWFLGHLIHSDALWKNCNYYMCQLLSLPFLYTWWRLQTELNTPSPSISPLYTEFVKLLQ